MTANYHINSDRNGYFPKEAQPVLSSPSAARRFLVWNRCVDVQNYLQAETLQGIQKFDDGKEDHVLKDCLLSIITTVAFGEYYVSLTMYESLDHDDKRHWIMKIN